jgi:hypothetical protein
MHRVAMHQAEKQLPLRSDLQAIGSKSFGELGR